MADTIVSQPQPSEPPPAEIPLTILEGPTPVLSPFEELIRAFRKWLTSVLPRKKTRAEIEEERAQAAEAARLQALKGKLHAEAVACAWQIRRTLTDLNICYRYAKNKEDFFASRVKEISFLKEYRINLGPFHLFPQEIYGLTEEALYLPVDLGPGARPRGVGLENLCDEKVLENLSINVGRRVSTWRTEADGFGYIVWRTEGIRAVPVHVKYDDMLLTRPASADALAVPIGEASGKRKIWRSLGHMVSMLVAGTTSGGKSNFLNVAIATLVNYNSPSRLRIGLIDLKRGVEFTSWLGLPHILNFKFEGSTPCPRRSTTPRWSRSRFTT